MKLLCFLFLITLGLRNYADALVYDSSKVMVSQLEPKDSSLEYALNGYSKGGEGSLVSSFSMIVKKETIQYERDYYKSTIKINPIISDSLSLLADLITNYKTEFDSVGCSMALDGYRYRLEFLHYAAGTKTIIESGDYDFCYYQLCKIFRLIENIRIELEENGYKKVIEIMRKDNIPCRKILEINRTDQKNNEK